MKILATGDIREYTIPFIKEHEYNITVFIDLGGINIKLSNNTCCYHVIFKEKELKKAINFLRYVRIHNHADVEVLRTKVPLSDIDDVIEMLMIFSNESIWCSLIDIHYDYLFKLIDSVESEINKNE